MDNNVKTAPVEMPVSGEFSESEEMVASMLAVGKSQVEIQKATGIDTKTIRRWLKRDNFRQLVRSTRRGIDLQVVGELSAALKDAVAALILIATNGERDSDRIRACDAILTHYLKFEEYFQIDERLTVLEAAAEKAAESAKQIADKQIESATTAGDQLNPSPSECN